MTSFLRISLACAAAASLALLSPGAAPAAGGLAYGSVTKFSAGSDDGPAPQPGTYRTDFATAAAPASSGGDSPKMPFGLGKMLAKAQSAAAMFQNGTAEKHYIGTNKERVDAVAAQTADITDCTARTITHLDLAKKTYSVRSLDQPEVSMPSSGGHHETPGAMPTDDGTRVALDVTTKALGPLTIEGVPTNGYATNIKMTMTRGTETHSTNMTMTAYYAAMDEPHFGCGEHGFGGMAAGLASMAMANYGLMMKALQSRGNLGSRFSFTNSGPSLPAGKLAMWQDTAMTAAGQDGGGHGHGSFNVIMERGDVHAPLADSDPIFGVPAGFTKVDSN